MKKLLSIIALVMLAMVFAASEASAYSFGFEGAFQFTPQTDGTTVLDFNQAQSTPQDTSGIEHAVPGFDSVLNDGSYVILSPFTLNPTPVFVSSVPGVGDINSYSFLDNPYTKGFQVYNATGTLLMEADITLDKLYTLQTGGVINLELAMNLRNVVYSNSGKDSSILAAFVDGGAVNFTLQATQNIDSLIQNGGSGTYSATTAPIPEPSTVLLLGGGLLGMVAFGRKYMKK